MIDVDETVEDRLAPTTVDSIIRSTMNAAAAAADLVLLEAFEPSTGFWCSADPRHLARHALLSRLSAWVTRTPAAAGVGDVVLLAVAATDDPSRRAAVLESARLVHDLLQSARERQAALRQAAQASRLAGVDPLTGLGNRRAWRQALDQETARQRRYRSSTSVVVVDLDNLKQVNDDKGHEAGDDLLRRAASALRAAARKVDVVCRLGGDEFAVLAPRTDAAGCRVLLERVRNQLQRVEVAASCGTATTDLGELDEAWQLADADMYDDKHRRREGT